MSVQRLFVEIYARANVVTSLKVAEHGSYWSKKIGTNTIE